VSEKNLLRDELRRSESGGLQAVRSSRYEIAIRTSRKRGRESSIDREK